MRDVAAALNVVQRSALDLAVEQAVLRRNIADSFVNMGRRNQNLLDRQLDFITDLERDEADPDRLAGLFRLDHLATRMRRNAESLLRLAGSEPPAPVVGVRSSWPTSCAAPSARSRTTSGCVVRSLDAAAVHRRRRRRPRPRPGRAARERPVVLAARPSRSRSGAASPPTATSSPSPTTASA